MHRSVSPFQPTRLVLLAGSAVALGLFPTAALADDPAPEAPEAAASGAQEPQFAWQEGPGEFLLGDQVARVALGESHVFLDGLETRRFLEATHNPSNGNEVGFVGKQDESWWLIFEWEQIGYVKDDEKDELDADELLESYKQGTEEYNKERAKAGLPGLHVVGWQEKPHYDPVTHNLVWAILARNDNGRESINYNVRLLGREGVMSVTLIESAEKFAQTKPAFEKVLKGFNYLPGKTYAEFKPGDKVAEYGLTALVAAGAGAAAVKFGLFKVIGKFLKPILVGVAVLGAAIVRLVKGLFGGRGNPPPSGP
jgi:uncharacterized membrane-anchored protein